MRFLLLFSFILLLYLYKAEVMAQSHTVDNFCISQSEEHLAALINTYRKQNRLPEISLSASLSFVAKTHIADLQRNQPDTSICSTASWSDQGLWTPCCYQAYVLKNECMWDKPKELTPYTFRGYELSYFDEGIIAVDKLWELWISTEEVTEMLLTKGKHADKNGLLLVWVFLIIMLRYGLASGPTPKASRGFAVKQISLSGRHLKIAANLEVMKLKLNQAGFS